VTTQMSKNKMIKMELRKGLFLRKILSSWMVLMILLMMMLTRIRIERFLGVFSVVIKYKRSSIYLVSLGLRLAKVSSSSVKIPFTSLTMYSKDRIWRLSMLPKLQRKSGIHISK